MPAHMAEPSTPDRTIPRPGSERLSAHAWAGGRAQALSGLDDIEHSVLDPEARIWVDVEEASPHTLSRLAEIFELHELVAEDIIERNQRAKLVTWDSSLHLVLFAIRHERGLELSEIDMVLGSRFLVTSHPAEWQPLEALRADARTPAGLLGQGTDMLLYGLIDRIVDGYFPVIDRISDELDELEDALVVRTDRTVVERLFRVRRQLLEVRHVVGPEREILNQLSNRDVAVVDPDHRVYFRDVYDHTIRVTDELDTHRELASGVLDAYLSSVNNDLSEVMKRLTAITAVLAGIGAAAGLFGMSEAASSVGLSGPLGFWAIVAAVLAVGVVVFVYFRRIDWI
jgi:magnesium transporter